MKRVIFSDLHLHPWSYGAGITAEGYNTRLWKQRKALDEIVAYVRKHNVRHAYFCGDLFHVAGQINTQAFMIAMHFFQLLRDSGCKIRAIAGNHDQVGRSGFIHTLAGLHPDEFTCKERTWKDDGLLVRGLSYTEDEEILKAFLGKAGEGEGGLVLLHQGVSGLPLASGFILDERLTPSMIPDNCDAFTGHYHLNKKVSKNLTVVGNLTALNWGDIDLVQGFIVYDDETRSVKQIPTSSPRFVSYPGGKVKGNFVRWTAPIRLEDQDSIRASYLEQGALSVEFPNIEMEVGVMSNLRCGEAVTVEHVLKTFQNEEMEPRRLEVGEEIRGENYETP